LEEELLGVGETISDVGSAGSGTGFSRIQEGNAAIIQELKNIGNSIKDGNIKASAQRVEQTNAIKYTMPGAVEVGTIIDIGTSKN
jgi:hypothetical protein